MLFGTTSCRVLETVADKNGYIEAMEGDTQIFIYPGYQFKILDGLITNFHLPQSTLLMLVSAICRKRLYYESIQRSCKREVSIF